MERQNLSCMYLAHHELQSILNIMNYYGRHQDPSCVLTGKSAWPLLVIDVLQILLEFPFFSKLLLICIHAFIE